MIDACRIFNEYQDGKTYKDGIGKRGIARQAKMNERFFVGDQWYGAKCGNDRPLVRENIIKRIGDYKISAITAAPISVNYTAEGVPENNATDEEKKFVREQMMSGEFDYNSASSDIENATVMRFLSDYFRITAERLKFDEKKADAAEDAYITGTCISYTYWDERIQTGLYADEMKSTPIKGDINFEILDVDNVVFGEANNDDVQSQPYIIVSQRRDVKDVKREAKRNGVSDEEIENIVPDNAGEYSVNAGTRGEMEPQNSKRVTVMTKFYKEWDENGEDYKVMCVRCTKSAIVRKPWDIRIKLYPFAKMSWLKRRSCVYGDSEITYLIPNQIAINRGMSANIWSIMTTGMPITLVNNSYLQQPLTNTPGQIIEFTGSPEEIDGIVKHISPPVWSPQMMNALDSLIEQTLNNSGANDAALGNLRPENASAIVQVREAALQPLQIMQNRFYSFIEDNARIWAQFWLNCYGDRSLKVETPDGYAYVPFYAERYKDLIITAKIDVGASTMYSDAAVAASLDQLLINQFITKEQYFERYPNGLIPNKTGILNDIKEEEQRAQMMQEGMSSKAILNQFAQQRPELYQKFQMLSPEEQQQMLANAGAVQ